MERRLAAILAADVVGYTKLMGTDETGTLKRVKELFSNVVEPAVTGHGGRIVKLMGDGLLAQFPSVVEAVQCAVDIQNSLAHGALDEAQNHAIKLRIGVNVGDIIVDGDDIFGDGVNVASRLEALAVPGGICISRSARDQIRDKLDFGLQDLGEMAVKNVARPVRVFRLLPDTESVIKKDTIRRQPAHRLAAVALAVVVLAGGAFAFYLTRLGSPGFDTASVARMSSPLPDRPSIAVIPFRNLSDDDLQSYFADGITEDIIADLSKVSGVLVVAYGSTRNYRADDVVFRQVAEDLSVRHVLTGSVRRAEDQLRVTVQLVDAISGAHIWGEKFDRRVDDVFVVQSEIASQVVKAMSVTLKANEHDRLFQKYAANIDAYDAFLRARASVDAPTRQNIANGELLFRRAIELDPDFPAAYAGLSFNYSVKSRFRFGPSPKDDAKLSLELARKAVGLDKNLAWSHIALAGAFLANGHHEDAVDAVRTALALQPNGYEANLFTGFYLNFAGEPAEAVKYLEAANELSRIDTIRGLDFLGMAYFTNGQYADCEATWLKRFQLFGIPNYPIGHVFLAAALSSQGKTTEAAEAVERFQRVIPEFRMSKWLWIENYKRSKDRAHLYQAALKAGIPE